MTDRAVGRPEAKMLEAYDRAMNGSFHAQVFENSDFGNFGYWEPRTRTQREASENLVEKLLAFLPAKSGTILDIACGQGATTRHLLNYYDAANVTAINLSAVQLARARENAPGCRFIQMDAAKLEFEDASFDNVICVEAALHFNTRDDYLREVLRVLKPGGRLVQTDILLPPLGRLGTMGDLYLPAANYLRSPAAFRARLAEIGFENIEVQDVTSECWNGWRHNLKDWPLKEWRAGRLTLQRFLFASAQSFFLRYCLGWALRYYVMASAQKPQPTAPTLTSQALPQA